jgi:hypothetical protein
MHPKLLPLAAVVLGALPLCAQRTTWIVDVTGGAGSHFTQVDPAVLAARDGDVILIRPGLYASFTVWKAVSILGEPGAGLLPRDPNVTVLNAPAGKDLVIQGLAWFSAFARPITVQDCAGRVLIDRCVVQAESTSLEIPAISIVNSRQVTLNECIVTGGPGISATDSTLAIVASEVNGHGVFPDGNRLAAQPAVVAVRSRLVAAQSKIWGGDGTVTNGDPPAPGLAALEATMTIAGDSQAQVGAGSNSVVPFPAILGNGGTLQLDPSVTLVPNSGPAIGGSVVVTRQRYPSLSGSAGRQGGATQLDLFSPAGEPFAILLGLPGDRVSLTGFGEFWINFAQPLLFLAQGTQGGSEHFRASLPLSSNPLLRGFSLTLQAISGVGGGAISVSNPFTFVLR